MHLFILAILGCGASKTPVAATPTPTPQPETPAKPTASPEPVAVETAESKRPDWKPRAHMDMHFTFVSDALFELIEGDLEGVRTEAAKLSTHETASVPEEWAPFVDEMLARSRALEATQTPEDAATQLVAVAQSCASCHQSIKGPDVSLKGLTDDHVLFGDSGMERHEWAVFRMWMGLIVPDAEIYRSGAQGLVLEEGAFPALPEHARPLHERVLEGGALALAATSDAERGKVFAELVPTCFACHTELDVTVR